MRYLCLIGMFYVGLFLNGVAHAQSPNGVMDDVRIYNRALGERNPAAL